MDGALSVARRLAAWGVRGGGLLMLAAAVLVSVDVLVRKLFSVTVGGADELSGYAFAIGTAWSFAFVTIARGHVRVDALYTHLSPRVAAALDLASLVALGVVAALLARYGWEVFAASWNLSARSNSALKVPLWIPQLVWWLGLLLFAVTLALLMVRAAALLVRGDLAGVRALAGARTIQEDADDESAYARARDAGGAAR